MNSLVVLLSVVALAVAKPSGSLLAPSVVAYSAPIIAAGPAAVSHQSRLDIKSSSAVVATAAVAPIARTVIAEPTILAAPAVATAAIAPAAVSSQSRIDIKTTPAVTSTFVSAGPVAYSAPPAVTYNTALAYNAPVAYTAPISYSAPILTSAVAPTIVKTAIAGPIVPLETPEVAAARAAHLVAKAQVLADAHLIHKRSAPFIAGPVVSTYSGAPLISAYHTSPLAYSAPVALTTPLLTKAYSVHPW